MRSARYQLGVNEQPAPAVTDRGASGIKDIAGYPRAFVHPGEIFVATRPHLLTTVLGSCVTVCLWDPTTGVGGINHFLLPFEVKGRTASSRFGNVATRELIDRVVSFGTWKRNLLAKVFGGACVMSGFGHGDNDLGARNAEVAQDLLQGDGIRVVAKDVGGQRARKVIFRTDDGAAWVATL